MDKNRWIETQKVLIDSGALKQNIDPMSAYANRFLPGNKSD